MAADDYALLVGISRYRDPDQFPPLDGPLNDVERVRNWLIDTELGEGVPKDQVLTLTTDDELLKLPLTNHPPQTNWSPNLALFRQKFNDIAFDGEGRPIRHQGRLYLYFSGHGFSLSNDDSPSAALFTADSYGQIHSNLPGSVYAMAVKRARLFKEVVLIMDCCRDVFGNFAYEFSGWNQVENSASETAKLYALYAAPRRGKSQERELPDSDGKVVGLMTDALLRALKEAPSDVTGQVAGRVLTQVMAFNWANWYPVSPMPPAPRGVYPDQGEIYFNSRQPLVSVAFTSPTALVPGSTMHLRSETLNAVATVGESSLIWRDMAYSWSQEIPLTQPATSAAQQFTLVLPPGKHELSIGATVHSFDPGVSNAIAL